MIVNELIQIAWRNSTLIDEEEEPTSSEASAGLRLLNSTLASYNVKSWWPYTRTEVSFELTGQQTYTIGNKDIDTGLVVGTGPNLYTVTVDDTSKYTIGSFINVRLKLTPQICGGDGRNWSCDVLGIDSSTKEITFGLNEYDLEVGNEVYMKASGDLPDIVTFRPSQLSVFKYKIGNTLVPVNQTTLATWDDSVISDTSTTVPYDYRFLPNVPYAMIDLGRTTISGYKALIGYELKISEVEYSTDLSEMLPPEYVSALEYILSAQIMVVNNRTEPQGVIATANARKKELMRNNIDVPNLDSKINRKWYDYKSGSNRRG